MAPATREPILERTVIQEYKRQSFDFFLIAIPFTFQSICIVANFLYLVSSNSSHTITLIFYTSLRKV